MPAACQNRAETIDIGWQSKDEEIGFHQGNSCCTVALGPEAIEPLSEHGNGLRLGVDPAGGEVLAPGGVVGQDEAAYSEETPGWAGRAAGVKKSRKKSDVGRNPLGRRRRSASGRQVSADTAPGLKTRCGTRVAGRARESISSGERRGAWLIKHQRPPRAGQHGRGRPGGECCAAPPASASPASRPAR